MALPFVDGEEIAFAMALFVSAANGRIHAANIGPSGFPVEENLWELVDTTAAGEEPWHDSPGGTADFAPLSRALSVLWHHYNGDVRQRAIWCRVVAFHAMMVKTKGSVVRRWTVEHEDDPSVTSLHSAVVNAVAEAPLSEFGEFDPSAFVQCVERFDATASSVTPAFVKDAGEGSTEADAGAVLARLRAPLSVLVGSAGLQAMIARAMMTNTRTYPWLQGANLTSEGFRVSLSPETKPSKEELCEGEAAVTSSLLKALRDLVGEGVATNLLASVFGADNAPSP